MHGYLPPLEQPGSSRECESAPGDIVTLCGVRGARRMPKDNGLRFRPIGSPETAARAANRRLLKRRGRETCQVEVDIAMQSHNEWPRRCQIRAARRALRPHASSRADTG